MKMADGATILRRNRPGTKAKARKYLYSFKCYIESLVVLKKYINSLWLLLRGDMTLLGLYSTLFFLLQLSIKRTSYKINDEDCIFLTYSQRHHYIILYITFVTACL